MHPPAPRRRAQSSCRALLSGVVLTLLPLSAQAQDDESVVIEGLIDLNRDVRNDTRNNALFLEGMQERLADSEQRSLVGKPTVTIISATEIQGFNNRDLRALDETTDQSVILSDDRTTFGHSDAIAFVSYRPSASIQFNLQAKYDILWRDDSLGRRADSAGTLNLFQINFDYDFVRTDDIHISTRIGRQPFRIGGVPRDYVLEGTLDALSLTVDAYRYGALRILAADLFGGNNLPVVGYQFYRDGSETIFGLRGETNTFRHGAIYEIDGADTNVPITAKAYYFFTSYGGGPIEESGADLTFGGAFGNFRDRDYSHLYGARLRASANLGSRSTLTTWAEYSGSSGIDRKPEFFYDVDLGGSFYGGGVTLDVHTPVGIDPFVGLEVYRTTGATFASDGVEFERGYVGGRGARIGSLAIGRMASWRNSAVMDSFGIDYTPHDISRAAGTHFLHASAGLTVRNQFQVLLDWWTYTDSSTSLVDFADIDNLREPGFGLSREEILAQRRLGRHLGQEFNLELRQTFDQHLALYTTGGLFLPGSYYDIEVSQLAGRRQTSLGGGATFYTWRFGGEVRF
jgi:hypothetical protein